MTCLAEIITGKVVDIHDGDTITVRESGNTQHKIRLNGIDVPELGQPFGQASKRNLSDLVIGKTVNVETDKTDRYGRLVGTVMLVAGTPILPSLGPVSLGISSSMSAALLLIVAKSTQTLNGKRARRGGACGLILHPWHRGTIGILIQPRRRQRRAERFSAIAIHRFITGRIARTMPRSASAIGCCSIQSMTPNGQVIARRGIVRDL